MTLNVLGFISLTIVGTLMTLLPTVLRGPDARVAGNRHLLAAGRGLGGGCGRTRARCFAGRAAGCLVSAAGAAGLVSMASRALRTERRWPAPVCARHFVAAVAWYVLGSFGLAIAMLVSSFHGYRRLFLVAFVGGWTIQVLLGRAWSYLLPMGRPAHPNERRGFLAMLETGGTIQVLALAQG